MSSSLNLNPDLPLIGIQAGLFLANMMVVKKLILEPYLRVKAARDNQTGGSQEEAKTLLAKATELDTLIAGKMRDAHKTAAATREEFKGAAMTRRTELLAATEKAAKKEQLAIQTAVATNLSEERARCEESIAHVTDQFVAQAIQ